MDGANEVHLSSGDTSTAAQQVREILTLIPRVDFSEKGEAGVPEGAVVVLSAEQVKALGFTTKEEPEGDDAELSAEEKADKELIGAITQFIPADKRKEA